MRKLLVLLTVLLLGLPAVAAETYPSKPVKVIYPYGPGAGDLMVRPWLEKLSQRLGQQFVLEYKAGASGAIGTEAVAKAPADGYTLLAVPNPVLTMLPHMRATPYDWNRDLRPVGRLANQVSGVMLSPKVPAGNLKELVALLRAKPDGMTCGSAGLGTVLHVSCELLGKRNGVKINHIPYKGAGEAINDLVAGHIDMMAATTSFPQAKAGTVKLIAVIDSERHPDFPNVPTLAESGVPSFEIPVWFGLFAPKATPTDIVERINKEMLAIAETDELKARLLAVGFRPFSLRPDAMHAQMVKETADMAAMLKEANVKFE